MYESLTSFLETFSAGNPLVWALTATGCIAGFGLALYVFWEVVLTVASFLRGLKNRPHRDADA